MGTFLLVLAIFAILLAGMSIGVIMGRKPISGTCGGLGAMGIDGACEICGGDRNKCEEENDRTAAASGEVLAYDATQGKEAR